MDQRELTFNHTCIDDKDNLSKASMAENAGNIGDSPTKHAPASASENKSSEKYRAEIFGNKLRAARNK